MTFCPDVARALFAALALVCASADARAQDADALRAATDTLERAPAAERATLGSELAALCASAEAHLPAGDDLLTDPAPRALVRALARALTACAELGTELTVDERVALFERARRAAARGGQSETQARAGLLAAHLLIESGRARAAWERVELTRRSAPGAAKTLPFLLRARAEAERQLGRLVDALATLDEAERATPAGDAWQSLGWRIPGARGSAWLDLGLTDLAAEQFERETKALAVATRPDPHDLLAAQLHELGLALARADGRSVVARCDELLARDALVRTDSRWRGYVEAQRARALAQRVPRDPSLAPAARAALRAALATPQQDARERASLAVRLAELELRAGDPAASEQALATARASCAELEDVPERAELDTLDARLALTRDTSRARLAELRNALRAHVATQLGTWRALPLRGGGHAWLRPGARRALLVELMRLELSVDGPEAALAVWLGIEAETALARRAGVQAATLAELRAEYLVPGQSVLVWCVGPENGVVFSLDTENLAAELLPGGEEALRTALERWRARGAATDARELRELCFPERARARLVPGTALTLVGLEVLGDPVLEELPLADGVWLGESVAVDVLPSLALGLAWARAAERDTGFDLDLLAVAATRPAHAERPQLGALEDLAVADDELDALAAPFARVLSLRGAAVTRAAFLALPFERARALHFLGHGAQDYTRERPAVLVLAEDAVGATGRAIAGCDEVETLRGPPLVVLASCATASGPLRPGEGQSAGLPAAWLAAGTRCVVASPRDVPLDVALAFSSEFHAALARSAELAPAEALRRVRARHAEDPTARAALAAVRVIGLGQRAPSRIAARTSPGSNGAGGGWSWGALAAPCAGLVALALAMRTWRRRTRAPREQRS